MNSKYSFYSMAVYSRLFSIIPSGSGKDYLNLLVAQQHKVGKGVQPDPKCMDICVYIYNYV